MTRRPLHRPLRLPFRRAAPLAMVLLALAPAARAEFIKTAYADIRPGKYVAQMGRNCARLDLTDKDKAMFIGDTLCDGSPDKVVPDVWGKGAAIYVRGAYFNIRRVDRTSFSGDWIVQGRTIPLVFEREGGED